MLPLPTMISALCQGCRHRFVADQNLTARSACPCPSRASRAAG